MNDYDAISGDYVKSHEKPDKKYSMLATALSMIGSLQGKKVVDVGCGDGFFTREFAKTAEFVYGIDNSKEQINKAIRNKGENISYQLADMNDFLYPQSDVVFAPFVLNYLEKAIQLDLLFRKFYDSLNVGGVFGGIVDMPQLNVHDMRKFGVVKKIARLNEGEQIEIELYNGGEYIATLYSFFHTRETIEKLLVQTDFSNIVWHKPIISKEGLKVMREVFWEGYVENCDLAYFTAKK